MQERSTIKCEIVNSLRSFSPNYIISHPDATIKKFEKALTSLINSKFLKPVECGLLLKQYKCFTTYVALEHKTIL